MKCLFQKRLWCGTSVKRSKQVHNNHCEDQDSKVDILSEESEKAMTELMKHQLIDLFTVEI